MKTLNVKVKQMTSPRTYNPVANQFIIYANNCTYFQSYNSAIAVKTSKGIILDEYYWDYSKTTGKYRNEFLGEGINETRRKIKEGIYKLTNLNK